MIDWSKVKAVTIPEGDVQEISIDGVLKWKEEEFTRVKYLKSNGQQYIDTGISGINKNISYDIDLQLSPTQIYGYPILYGSRSNEGGSNRFYIATNDSLSRMYVGDGDKEYSYNPSNLGIDLTKRNHFKYNLNGDTRLYCNDKLITSLGNIFDVYTIYLMVCNFEGRTEKPISRCIVGDLYSSKISIDNVSVRDYIPVLDKAGRPALYDKVNNKYYYNQGLGEFGYETMDGTYVPPRS